MKASVPAKKARPIDSARENGQPHVHPTASKVPPQASHAGLSVHVAATAAAASRSVVRILLGVAVTNRLPGQESLVLATPQLLVMGGYDVFNLETEVYKH